MRHVVDLDARLWSKIQQLLREGRYDSVSQFITVALENQTSLEFQSLNETPTLEVALVEAVQELTPPSSETVGYNLSMPPTEPTAIRHVPTRSNEMVWSLYNRIFPVKITLRVLAQLLSSKMTDRIDLKSLRDQAGASARIVGRKLVAQDKKNAASVGERLGTGLPTHRGDKSLERFKDMFVGYVTSKGIPEGMPALLQFIHLERESSTRTTAALTREGLEFAKITNPVLDGGIAVRTTLSTSESDFYMNHIRMVLPNEWALCKRVIESIPEGSDTPASVDKLLLSTVPSLNGALVGATRAGVVSRLAELGFVRRRHDGLHVSYVLAERGEAMIRAAQTEARND